ncbi:serine-type carboxypeptidase F [Venturia nashicola]|uniref:Carboxypeptidase n=1 Tax=Venturia nashicola TaxID=86259 RepID=A0A4Z1PGU4_9PEZI|nr:serine-type carboxypeptidase F [Venturia nashicola]
MHQSMSRLAAFIACVLALLNGLSMARETMDERARSSRQRRSAMMTPVRRSPLGSRGNSTWRFLNSKSQAYAVNSLPDIHFDLGEMYAGQIPVGNDTSRNMFFVYQPTINNPVDEVVIWFNGGPGCSSLEGFLQENGRFIWGWGQYSATENLYTWVNLTNVLWVEYPVGTGFSTGNVTATSEEQTAADFIAFFKNFLDIFAIKNFKIYVTGESYAGRYVPYVSAAMLDEKDKERFDLKGALMYDPVIGQYEHIGQTIPAVPYIREYKKFFNFNQTFMDQLVSAHKACGYADFLDKYMVFPPAGVQPWLEGGFNNKSVACDLWYLARKAAFRTNPCFNIFEISSMCPILSDPLAYPSDLQYQYDGMGGVYFNRSDVKAAIHVAQDLSWSECSGPVFVRSAGGLYRNGDTSLDPIQSVLPRVIEATNRVLIANGEYDFELITNGTLLSIQNMTWGGALGFQSAPTTEINIALPDLQYQATFEASGLGGFDGPGQGIMGVQHYERGLMWAETFQCGHMQPQFQPRSSYRHLQWLLGHINVL